MMLSMCFKQPRRIIGRVKHRHVLLLCTAPFLDLFHLLILLALIPPSCSLPDDIGGPQPGPFLVSVMGASLQSLPLPLPPPPPLHATIQHSLSLNGKTWVRWRGLCAGVLGSLSGSECRLQPALRSTFTPWNTGINCECGVLVKDKDNTCFAFLKGGFGQPQGFASQFLFCSFVVVWQFF